MSEKSVPSEAREAAMREQAKKISKETESNIQHGLAKPEAGSQPVAAGERIHWRAPDGNVITPEKEEIYRSPETLPEKEPGYGPKASFSDDPGKTATDDQTADAQKET